MIDDDALPPEGPGDADAGLAAEYVLRLLGPQEAAGCAEREARDPAFAARVAEWRASFEGLDDAFAPVAPPAGLQGRIEARLFGQPERAPSGLARLWRSVGLWQGIAAVAALVALYLGVVRPPVGLISAPEGQPQLISALASVDSDVQVIVGYEPQAQVLTIRRLSGEPPPARDYELWVALGDDAPTSLGVLPDQQFTRIPLSGALAERVSTADHFAISDEADGGSTTGAPNTPVVALGYISEI